MGDLVPTASKSVEHLWKPGQSGNPKGRPKSPDDLPALCRSHTREAVEKLVEIMRADDHGKALNAVQQLLDRGWGRPVTPIVDETEGTSLTLLHLIAARRVGEVLQAAMDGKAEPETGETKSATIDYSVPALE